jgi:hypothetical protein
VEHEDDEAHYQVRDRARRIDEVGPCERIEVVLQQGEAPWPSEVALGTLDKLLVQWLPSTPVFERFEYDVAAFDVCYQRI